MGDALRRGVESNEVSEDELDDAEKEDAKATGDGVAEARVSAESRETEDADDADEGRDGRDATRGRDGEGDDDVTRVITGEVGVEEEGEGSAGVLMVLISEDPSEYEMQHHTKPEGRGNCTIDESRMTAETI